MTRHTIQVLSFGWEFKCETDEKWLPVSQVPSNVHTELVHHGRIPDPNRDLNELEASWVAERTWHYRTTFVTLDTTWIPGTAVDLVFEGLDTFATVMLNENVILQSDNMFTEHRVSVDGILSNAENTLEIVFKPARRRGLDLVKEHPEHDFIVHQTEVSRGPVRKAQYHWGWDWGPILLTCGPWKPVRLEAYISRIENIRVDYQLFMSQGTPLQLEVSIHAQIVGPAAHIEVELLFDGHQVMALRESNDNPLDGPLRDDGLESWRYTSAKFALEKPHLWWPRGYGAQNLYELRLRSIADDGSTVLAEEHQTIGFRKVELIQESDEFGQSFYFHINDIDIFAGGSCWIPADSFLPQIAPQRYRDWISLLAEGNQNMIRVWGGGIYEHAAFYDACDSLGILVWQDFMFACASYPTYPSFLDSVSAEARHNIRRLRHHPSLVLWCGNNEDYQLIERYNLSYDFHDKDHANWLASSFPARYIYEHLLPTVLAAEYGSSSNSSSSGAPYHPGSPWGNGSSTTLRVDASVGDVHQWELWNGAARPWQQLARMGGRFVSEFGMPAYPHADTVARFVSDPAERYPGSATLDFHTKAVSHTRRLMAYLGENFRLYPGGGGGGRGGGSGGETDLERFIHLTQVLQADAVAAGYKAWRRQWGVGSRARRCGGVLVWQLNDCWPGVSWAVVDYFLVRKPAWYAIKRAMQPVAVGVARRFHDWTSRPADELWRRDTGHVDPRKGVRDVEVDVWVASSQLETVKGRVVVRFVSVKTGQEVRERLEKGVEVQANGCTEVLQGLKVEWDDGVTPEPLVVQASLWVDEVRVSSDISWPDPIKYLDFADRGVSVRHISQGLAEVSAEKPVKGLVFSERQGVKLSDNGFDLVPGDEPMLVRIEGDVGGELPWTFVGQ
ncbi:Beta-mannosidase B [Madurella fahalii]|uniref:Beta-mannosidase B n=1 Tax=Madurella fahalii TaxID=1157608 RepID=A0ABQ0GEK9_9PEZI